MCSGSLGIRQQAGIFYAYLNAFFLLWRISQSSLKYYWVEDYSTWRLSHNLKNRLGLLKRLVSTARSLSNSRR
jgi:hypothetical protein